MIWSIWGDPNRLNVLFLEAESFDEAIKIARKLDCGYCGGMVFDTLWNGFVSDNWRLNDSVLRDAASIVMEDGYMQTVRVEFSINDTGSLRYDRTEFDAESVDDLADLWIRFCFENSFDPQNVDGIEVCTKN